MSRGKSRKAKGPAAQGNSHSEAEPAPPPPGAPPDTHVGARQVLNHKRLRVVALKTGVPLLRQTMLIRDRE